MKKAITRIDVPEEFCPLAKAAFQVLPGNLFRIGKKIVFTYDDEEYEDPNNPDLDNVRGEWKTLHEFEEWLLESVSGWIGEWVYGKRIGDQVYTNMLDDLNKVLRHQMTQGRKSPTL